MIYKNKKMELIKKGKEWYTPERNKIQKEFLKDDYSALIVSNICDKRVLRELYDMTEFEGEFGWDVIIKGVLLDGCKCGASDRGEKCINQRGCERECNAYVYINICVELGEDYGYMLRMMKEQIRKTMKYNEELKMKEMDELKKEAITASDRNRIKEIDSDFINWSNYMYHGEYILLVKKLNTESITRDEVKDIFIRDNINVIFLDETDEV